MRLLDIVNCAKIAFMELVVRIAYINIVVFDVEWKAERLGEISLETVDGPKESPTHVRIRDRKLLEPRWTSMEPKLEGDPSYQTTHS